MFFCDNDAENKKKLTNILGDKAYTAHIPVSDINNSTVSLNNNV